MKKQERIKGGMFDGMTEAEAEAFVDDVLSKRPDTFQRVGDEWELTPKARLQESAGRRPLLVQKLTLCETVAGVDNENQR